MLYQTLEKMKERQGLYPCENVIDIFVFIQGYSENVTENDTDFANFKGFNNFVINYFKNNSTHPNWSSLINFYSSSGKESFDKFFELLEKFRAK